MKSIKTKLEGVVILEPDVHIDNRGFFMECWSKSTLEKLGLYYDFVQENHAKSTIKGTLRGIHFQKGNKAQAKLVRCIKGAILDVVVDLRYDSPNYREWIAVELSEKNKRQLLIPKGFGHGVLTLTDGTEFTYKVDEFYAPDSEGGILWSDPDIGVEWGIEKPIISTKDNQSPLLKDVEPIF